MLIPDPVIWGKPINVWLGFLVLALIILQILIGTRILKLPFWIHRRVVWILILIVGLIHGFIGFELYFLIK